MGSGLLPTVWDSFLSIVRRHVILNLILYGEDKFSALVAGGLELGVKLMVVAEFSKNPRP